MNITERKRKTGRGKRHSIEATVITTLYGDERSEGREVEQSRRRAR